MIEERLSPSPVSSSTSATRSVSDAGSTPLMWPTKRR